MSNSRINVLNEAAETDGEGKFCMSRREVLLTGVGTTFALGIFLPKVGQATVLAKKVRYRPKVVGKLSALKTGQVQGVLYPDEHRKYGQCILMKLGTRSGGGVGAEEDIVCFSGLCTHMGGLLTGSYNHDYRVIGPCPTHLTTFDPTRYGMVVAGHATESLPQITLTIDGDDIVANGVMGLMFGRTHNV
jgi:arsenite oxidase small subunit